MLRIIKEFIDDLPDITFNEFFIQYMIAVQDSNIDSEFRKLASRNILDVKSMEKLLNQTMEVFV